MKSSELSSKPIKIYEQKEKWFEPPQQQHTYTRRARCGSSFSLRFGGLARERAPARVGRVFVSFGRGPSTPCGRCSARKRSANRGESRYVSGCGESGLARELVYHDRDCKLVSAWQNKQKQKTQGIGVKKKRKRQELPLSRDGSGRPSRVVGRNERRRRNFEI